MFRLLGLRKRTCVWKGAGSNPPVTSTEHGTIPTQCSLGAQLELPPVDLGNGIKADGEFHCVQRSAVH